MNNHLEEMISDAGDENYGKAHVYGSSKSNFEPKFYP